MIDLVFLSLSILLFMVTLSPRYKTMYSDYKWIALALVADFCAHIGFDTYILSTEVYTAVSADLIYTIFMPLKGTISLIFFMVFLNISIHLARSTHAFITSIILCGLSAFSAVFHFFVAKFNFTGQYFEEYSGVMTLYCIMQLTVMLGGLMYGYVHRPGIHHNSWRHHFHNN